MPWTNRSRTAASDFERAQYYFELALDKFARPFSVLNDLGWLFAAIANPPDFDRARSAFEESLRRKPKQQRRPSLMTRHLPTRFPTMICVSASTACAS